MITSGKSDERQINSNKIKNIYVFKNKNVSKRKINLASAVHLACLWPNFFVFLILNFFKIYKQFICLDKFFCFINCYNISGTFLSGSQR